MSLVSPTKIEGKNIKQPIAESLCLLNHTLIKSFQNVVIEINVCYCWDYLTGPTIDLAFAVAAHYGWD